MTGQYIMGLDPAQLRDWSALVITKRTWNEDTNENHYQIEALDRKQHLPYNEIVDWVVKVFKDPRFWPNEEETAHANCIGRQPRITSDPEIVIDSTGVGRALWDLLRNKDVGCIGATITAGGSLDASHGVYTLGKSLMLGRFSAAWDGGRVERNPNHPLVPILEDEMAKYRVEISKSGNLSFNAPPGEHDDLLFAAALSVWWGEEARQYE